MDIVEGITVVATSEDSINFAHMSLTTEELTLDDGTHEGRKFVI